MLYQEVDEVDVPERGVERTWLMYYLIHRGAVRAIFLGPIDTNALSYTKRDVCFKMIDISKPESLFRQNFRSVCSRRNFPSPLTKSLSPSPSLRWERSDSPDVNFTQSIKLRGESWRDAM